MIEKIMKAVKSSNKRRGRNITIGAVVGFLLSCTAVMGADDNYLWIKKDGEEIKFNTTATAADDGNWDTENPYSNNNWDTATKTYTNNMMLSSSEANGKDGYGNISYGLRLSGELTDVNFVNNGSVIGIIVPSGYGYGIYNEASKMGNIENAGVISGIGSGPGYGIYNSGTMENIINTGIINGSFDSSVGFGNGNGIYNYSSGTIKNIINTGVISASTNGSGPSNGYGINNSSSATMGNITNAGVVSGYGSAVGYGINNEGNKIGNIANTGIISGSGKGIVNVSIGSKITTITNTGVIYGKTNAIENVEDATIDTVDNYGILATDGDDVVDDKASSITENNYGLYIGKDGKITLGQTSSSPTQVVVGYDKDGKEIKKYMTIRNATLIGESGKATETVSFLLAGEVEKFDNSILNGKNETLKVSGTGNQITDSIINAYQTAVVMNENMSTLTLNNTVVNGGISGENTVKIEGDGNTLNVQGDSIINGVGTAITVTGNNNALVLEGNAKVNGKMESTGNNTLSLNGNAEDGMNMQHDISGFVNMNIENNVTLFESIEVTGTETVTVHKDGVLNLRLKRSEDTKDREIPIGVHAFSEREGKHEMVIKGTSEGEAGTLNFITNGIGKKIDVDMKNIELENMLIKASSIIDKAEIDGDYIHLGAGSDLSGIVNPKVSKYSSLNGIYKSLYNSTDENIDALRDMLSMTYLGKNYDYNNATDEEQLKTLMSYLDSIYTGTPYSYSSELSRKSMGMFRDIVTENQFKPNLNQWLIMGGLTHTDGGTKDSYYGQNYHGIDTGTADVDVDMKLTGAYALGKYGYSENVSLGVTVGGNRSEAKLPMSKVKGNSGYIGAFAENYRGNLTLKAGAGIQYSEYDADRGTLGGHSYSDKYSDMTYDIYLNGRYSHNIGNNLFLEPYGTLSYTYITQDSADEGSKVLAIETDSKSFDYTAAKVGVDLKKVIPHEKGKSTLSAGVSYTRLLTGADEENITGRFKGENATDFDILVAHKNEHSIGLNAKYALELESGILFDVKGSYSFERDSHNESGKNRNKGEWIVGAGLGYKF
ncbi:autotransporter outer membrane beta-barrel domain-containing protein [Fusobacterium varium]|uniref:autotransporter family protein n=1 Tax=Fusobacterium varium TaxID=856 RepID=UPI001F1AFEBD|nr:autotransporter outer membrane beta-barrel domain-containing protein [Fusobacterium varium]MCF2674679.1 autotransporter outer membrane beta-barrel domain-containing protein [Fusobacterium varium]